MIRLKITFRDMRASEPLEFCIQHQVEKLDSFSGPIQSCEVVVQKAQYQSKIKTFQVRVKIVVEGEEIVVNHTDPTEEHSTNAYAVVRKAFDLARRQLLEFRQRQRGEVKLHTAIIS